MAAGYCRQTGRTSRRHALYGSHAPPQRRGQTRQSGSIRLNASRDGLDSTRLVRGCTLTRSCAARCAIRSGGSKRASNKETLTVAGSRIPVIPQLTADTMRHRRTTNVPFPMGKNEENEEIRGFWFAHRPGCTLERPPNASAGAEATPSSRPHLSIVPFQHPGPGILHFENTLPKVFMNTCSMYTKLRTSPSTARRPICLLHSSPGRTSKTGLVPKPQVPLCEVERLGLHLTVLESLGRQQQQNSSFAHSRSSRPPATDVQMHTGSDPISLGGDLHPFLAYLVTRSNPGLPWQSIRAILRSLFCDCDALVGWISRVCCATIRLQSHRHDTPRLLYLQVCLAMSLISWSLRP